VFFYAVFEKYAISYVCMYVWGVFFFFWRLLVVKLKADDGLQRRNGKCGCICIKRQEYPARCGVNMYDALRQWGRVLRGRW